MCPLSICPENSQVAEEGYICVCYSAKILLAVSLLQQQLASLRSLDMLTLPRGRRKDTR